MQVNPEDSPPDIFVTWSNPRMTDFENSPQSGFEPEVYHLPSLKKFDTGAVLVIG